MSINKNKIIASAQKFIQKGQIDKAILEYLKIVKEEPHDVRTWLRIGDLYAKENAKQEAIATYIKVAEYYTNQGFYLKAVAVYKQILKIDQNLIQINIKLAELYQQLGLTSDALSQYEQLVDIYLKTGKNDETIGLLEKMLEIDPDNIPIRIKLAESLSKKGDKNEAVKYFQIAAEKLKETGRMDDYIKVVERILWHKEDIGLAINLAKLYIERKDTKKALAKLQQSFQIDPQNIEILSLLAEVFKSIGQNGKAVSVYKEISRVYKSKNMEKEEFDIYNEILALDPNDAEAKEYINKQAKSKMKLPMLDNIASNESIEEFDEIEEVEAIEDVSHSEDIMVVEGVESKDEYERLITEAEVFIKYGLFSKAIDHLYKILDIKPDDMIARERLKEIYLKEGFTDEAIQQLFYLVNMLKDNDKEQAVEYLHEILSIDPYNSEGEALLKELEGERIPSHDEFYQEEQNAWNLEQNAEVEIDEVDPGQGNVEVNQGLSKQDYIVEGVLNEGVGQIQDREKEGTSGLIQSDLFEEQNTGKEYGEISLEDSFSSVLPKPEDVKIEDEVEFEFNENVSTVYQEPKDIIDKIEALEKIQEVIPPWESESVWEAGNEEEIKFELDNVNISEEEKESNKQEVQEISEAFRSAVTIHTDEDDNVDENVQDNIKNERITEIENGLEEADFFLQQQLYDEAKAVLRDLYRKHNNSKFLVEKIKELNSQQEYDGVNIMEDVMGSSSSVAEKKEEHIENIISKFKEKISEQVDSSDFETHFELGIAYKEMGLMDEAISEFELSKQSPTKEALSFTLIGLCRMELGQIGEAIESFKKGLYSNEKTPQEELGLYYELGNAYLLLEDIQEALYYFQKVFKRDPNFRDVSSKIKLIRSTLSQNEKNKLDEDLNQAFDELLKRK